VSTVQLRRYQITAGQMDSFVTWWKTLVPARRLYGFEVLFGFVDQSTNQFIWAVSHDGDFDQAEQEWMDSPERAALFAGPRKPIEQAFISKVENVLQ
jgi:hypothetical protein